MPTLTQCPVCESRDCSRAYEGRTARDSRDPALWQVFECRQCGHGFLNPQPSWKELQRYYDSTYEPYEAEHGVEGFEATLARARAAGGLLRNVHIRPGMRLLDVGCGGGVFLRLARELGAKVQGVEPSAHGAATCLAAGLPVFNGMLEDFVADNPEERFDLVTSNHVVEHHPQPVHLLRAMKALVAPGGNVWISVPNAACPDAEALTWRWHSTDLPYHLQQFTPNSLRVAAERAGFAGAELRTESLQRGVLQSLQLELRTAIKLPVRVSQHLPLGGVARRRAERFDRDGLGEAIFATMAVNS